MIRAVLTALWSCGVTFAGAYGASQLMHSSPPQVGQAIGANHAERYIEADLTAVPRIVDNQIEGYFLSRMAYVLDEPKITKTNIPIELLLSDFYLGYAYNNDIIKFTKFEDFNLDKFSDGLVEYINRRFGDKVVISNLILQIDYRKIKEVRSSITGPL